MNIDTSTKDPIDPPLGSNGSKGSFGSDDSLEYSNDDRSTAKTSDNDKINDKKLPPKHPTPATSIGDQFDSNLFTPKRKQYPDSSSDRLPGPLNLFSPGLSPIGHTSYSRYEENEENHSSPQFQRIVAEKSEVESHETYNTDLRDSVDSLDMVSPHFKDEKNKSRNDQVRDTQEDNRPNYQFWKNKLFTNDLVPAIAIPVERIASSPATQPFASPAVDSLHHKSYIRSNSNSFDSDFNLTPRQHSLVYPTTDALYERSAVVHNADVSSFSMDRGVHTRTGPEQEQQRQFVMYSTSKELLDARSPHRRADSSSRSTENDGAQVTMQSLMYPDTPEKNETEMYRHHHQVRQQKLQQQLHSPGSVNGSIDSDILHVSKQSLVYPTTRAVYEKSLRPTSDDVSVDSDMRAVSKQQSLVYPITAALFRRSGGASSVDTTLDSDHSFAHQSYLHKTHMEVEEIGEAESSLNHLSMLDHHSLSARPDLTEKREKGTGYGKSYSYRRQQHQHQYQYEEEDALGQSLHSISLLPGSPLAPAAMHTQPLPSRSVAIADRTKPNRHLLFPPSNPSGGFSPTSALNKNVEGWRESSASSRRTAQTSSSDTEFVNNSAMKRRAIEQHDRNAGKAGHVWREAEDLAPSTFTSLSKNNIRALKGRTEVTNEPAETPQSQPGAAAAPAASVRHFSPPLAPPSPSSVSGGSPSSGRMFAHHVDTGGGAQMEGSLVVGALYTLQVDSHGRPAFVPVVLSPQPAEKSSGTVFSSPHMYATSSAPGGATAERKVRYRSFTAATPQQAQGMPRFVSAPSNSSRRWHDGSAKADTLGLSAAVGANSNHVDVEMVLERALHRGSLSEEKIARRWSGDTTKRNSPPGAMSGLATSTVASVRDSLTHGHQHGHHQHLYQGLSPTTPLRSSAHHYMSTMTPSTSSASTFNQKKSPYRLVVGEDGHEHLQPSAEYFKERLLRRSLTSVLNSPVAGAAGATRSIVFGDRHDQLHYSPPIPTAT